MHPDITLEDIQLPLERNPKILGVIMDPYISFHKHCNYVSDRIDKRNNMLNALAGLHWGNLSQNMQHQSGAPTQVTRALKRYIAECGFEDGDRGPQDGQY